MHLRPFLPQMNLNARIEPFAGCLSLTHSRTCKSRTQTDTHMHASMYTLKHIPTVQHIPTHMHTQHIYAYTNAHAPTLTKTENSTSLVLKEEKGWQYDKLMGGVKTICFTNCTLRERINRRTLSQGPHPLPSFWPPTTA